MATKVKAVRSKTNSKGQAVNAEGELRKRCLTTGCNPVMFGDEAANKHKEETGHRTANMPVRSAERLAKDKIRNEEARKARLSQLNDSVSRTKKCECYYRPDECCNYPGCCESDFFSDDDAPCCSGYYLYDSFEDGYDG